MNRFLEINDNEDNLPVKILEGYNISKTPEIIPNDLNIIRKEFPERKFSNKKPRKYSDDKKRKKSIFKGIFISIIYPTHVFPDVYIASFHIAEHHFTVKFNIFEEFLALTFEKDKKINKEKLWKRLTECSKNWKQGYLIHFNEILAYVLNKCY